MAEITINNFTGGINNIIEPHLLSSNFAVDLKDAVISNGAIKSANGLTPLEDIDRRLINQNGERSIVSYGEELYWSDNVTGELDSTLGYLGVPKPEKQVEIFEGDAGGIFPGGTTYRYIYNFVSSDGIRSAPFSFEDLAEFEVTEDLGSIVLRNFDTDMSDFVIAVEVWRTLDNGAVFFRVGEGGRFVSGNEGGIVFNDTTPDSQLVFREQFDPLTIGVIPEDGKYLTERNSVFYVASGSRILFSVPGDPHSYPLLNFITFDDLITATISTEEFTMVFTENRAYRILGNTIVDLVKEEIPDAQGVANWKTVEQLKNMPMWISNDGLVAYQPYDNRSGRKITVLTENLFNVPLGSLAAAAANEVYYLFFEGETIAFDFVTNLKVYKLSWDFDWGWYDKDDDILVGRKDQVYFNAGGGEPLEWEYLSPDFVAETMHNLKQFSRVVADSDNDLELTFFADGEEVFSYTLPHDGIDNRREFVSPLVEGRRIQVKIKSTGTLRGISYEYITRRQ